MEQIILPAPAKINLFLDVRGLRPDGYHQLKMVMQSIALHDRLTIKKTEKGIKLTTNHLQLPDDERNLAYQAAELVLNKFKVSGGVEIYLEKKIPLAAGLAGGSSDAAAVLKGVNQLYNLEIPDQQLQELASTLGTDIPFCLKGGTALATERGDRLQQLPDLSEQNLIIITPPVPVSTPIVYREFDRLQPEVTIPAERLVALLGEQRPINWTEGWGNALEPVTINLFSDVKVIKEMLKERGVRFSLMSGSGPSVFAILDSPEQGKRIRDEWPRQDDFISITRTVKQDFTDLCRNS